jgi:Protein of unknown function (DUF559)
VASVVIGSEAVRDGVVTRHELSRWYRRLHPGVYAQGQPNLRDRIVGAWLWSRRRAVIAGVAASTLHGAPWVDVDVPIELIWANTHPPQGLTVRNETLHPDELTRVAGLPVTTVARTAFDMGRHLPRGEALARLDALMWATPFAPAEVEGIASRHPGATGLRALHEVLPLVDSGAASPKESWLRLVLVDAGLPRPTTQIVVCVNQRLMALDMGWERFKVAVEYDGDHHRTDRRQYVKDQRRLRTLEALGWIVIRVIAEDRPDDVIARVTKALRSRGWRPS